MRNIARIDELDRAILLRLRQDGRLSNAELARSVGLTPAPCLRRVQRLEREGVIAGYRAVLDPAAEGRSFEVVVAVEIAINDADSVAQFEEAVLGWDEVTQARRLFGLPDYYLTVNVADVASYERFVMERLTRAPGVSRVTSHQSMKTIKHTTA